MKRMKLLSLLAVLLAAVMALGSCGLFGGGEVDVEDLFDEKAVYKTTSLPTTATEVSALAGKSNSNYYYNESDLLLFTELDGLYTHYTVYNAATGTAVLDLTNSSEVTYRVQICELYDVNRDVAAYIRVTKTTDTEDDDEVKTLLYSASGSLLDETKGDEDVIATYADLVFFDNTFYRAANGTLAKHLDWSPMAKRPRPDDHVGDCYYELDDNDITVYGADLKVLSTYKVPSIAADGANGVAVLGNGDILVQYIVTLPENSEDYTAIVEDEDGNLFPVDVVTVIVDHENGEADEIDCEYLLLDIERIYPEYLKEAGLLLEGYTHEVEAYKIEDGRIPSDITGDEVFLLLDEDGDLTAIADFMSSRVDYFYMVGDNRWIVETEDREYLVDADGEVIGEVTRGYSTRGRYIVCDGKIYDMDLRELLDYDEKDLELASVYGSNGTLYFENDNGDFLKWSGSGEPTVVVSGEDEDKSVSARFSWGYAVSDSENSKTTVYNADGTQLFTVSRAYAGIETVVFQDSYLLVKTTDSDGDAVYYRLPR